MTGSRLLFWLHAFTRALSDRGYWSGVVICFSMRQPMTRASSADSSMFIVAVRSPYAYAIRGPEVQLLARFDAERVIPRVEVAHRVGAILGRGMAVGDDALPQGGLADLLTPALCEAQEEQLLAAEAGSPRRGLALERAPPGVVGHREARDVGDVLAQRLVAVDVDVGERAVGVELRDETLARGLEVREVALGPPVLQPPAGVEQRTLIVEAVADLVADDGAGGAVVHDGVALRVEVRRLQHRGRKVERIHRREIYRIDQLRIHDPLGAIDRGAELGEVVVQLEQLGALRVAERVAADHF